MINGVYMMLIIGLSLLCTCVKGVVPAGSRINANGIWRQHTAQMVPRYAETALNAFHPADLPPQVYVGLVALVGIGAGSLQGKMYSGNSGLGKFLNDGKGFKKSAYKPSKSREDQPDPGWLRNLKLPALDFVEVYGANEGVEEVRDEKWGNDIALSMSTPDVAPQADVNANAKADQGRGDSVECQEVAAWNAAEDAKRLRLEALEEEFDEVLLRGDVAAADSIVQAIESLND